MPSRLASAKLRMAWQVPWGQAGSRGPRDALTEQWHAWRQQVWVQHWGKVMVSPSVLLFSHPHKGAAVGERPPEHAH